MSTLLLLLGASTLLGLSTGQTSRQTLHPHRTEGDATPRVGHHEHNNGLWRHHRPVPPVNNPNLRDATLPSQPSSPDNPHIPLYRLRESVNDVHVRELDARSPRSTLNFDKSEELQHADLEKRKQGQNQEPSDGSSDSRDALRHATQHSAGKGKEDEKVQTKVTNPPSNTVRTMAIPEDTTPTVPIGDKDVKIPEDDRSNMDKFKDKMRDAKTKVEDTAKSVRDKAVETKDKAGKHFDNFKEKVRFRWGQFKRGIGKIGDRLKAPFIRDEPRPAPS